MPPSKPKPAEIASEAKKNYIPYIRSNFSKDWPSTSFLCYSESLTPIIKSKPSPRLTCRFAFYERDPVDLALEWYDPADKSGKPIPVIMPANDKRPGGDWEAGVMSPEECLCRRSNLFATITTPGAGNHVSSNYPIPTNSGIYSATVVIFRGGPDKYEPWQKYKALPIISVSPVKRPKLDATGKRYSFKQEKDMMRDQIYTALRIAVFYEHTRLCIGTFGLGSGFRNPTEEVALMWRDAILKNDEFVGRFQDVVFAFEAAEGSAAASASSSSKGSSSKSSSSKSLSSSSSKTSVASDLEIFRHAFRPENVHGAVKSYSGQAPLSPPASKC